MSNATSVVLFDLDGTLTDPSLGIVRCLEYALERVGGPAVEPGDLTRFIGPPLAGTFGHLLATDDDDAISAAIGAYRERFTEVGLFENELIDGMVPTLETFAETGAELRVATAKPTVYAERIIHHFDLDRFFPVVYGSELDGRRTDKVDLLAHILGAEGWGGGGVAMIGDRAHDVVGALAHGARSVGVLWGFGSRTELTEAGADAIVSRVEELPFASGITVSRGTDSEL